MIEINEKFIKDYTERLEDLVLQHLSADKANKTKLWSLKRAHDHVDKLVTTLFGVQGSYSGIIQYLADEQQHLNLTLGDAVRRAECMVAEGWSIKNENGRFLLLDSNFRKVKDVTGSPDIAPAPVVSEFGPENCWMLLEETEARKLAKEAAAHGVDTAMLSSPSFAYQFVVSKLGVDSPLFPFAQSYKGMGEILNKTHYFESKDLTSLEELRDEGFRISGKINPSEAQKSYMKSGTKGYFVLPVGDNYINGKPGDAIFVADSYWKKSLLNDLGINVEAPIQIGEMGFTFALGFEDTEHYASTQDLGEVTRLLYSIQSQNKARNYPIFDKIIGQLASIYVVENLIVGNSNFTLANVSLDTVKPQVSLRYSSQGRNYAPKQIKYALENSNQGASGISVVDFLSMCPPITSQDAIDNLSLVIRALPEKFKSAIKSAQSEDSYIQGNIDTLRSYL